MKNSTETYLKELIMNTHNLDVKNINNISEQNLFASGLDSLSLINMIIDIESTFGFEFHESDMIMENFSTITSISNLINKYTDKNN